MVAKHLIKEKGQVLEQCLGHHQIWQRDLVRQHHQLWQCDLPEEREGPVAQTHRDPD